MHSALTMLSDSAVELSHREPVESLGSGKYKGNACFKEERYLEYSEEARQSALIS